MPRRTGVGPAVLPSTLSMQAQAAVQALTSLRDTYGSSAAAHAAAPPSTSPPAVNGTTQSGSATTIHSTGAGTPRTGGTGVAATLAATQLYQRNAAIASHNLDIELAAYLEDLAGNQTIDRAAAYQLMQWVNDAMAALGPSANTPAGTQRAQAIVAAALQGADALIGNGHATAAETAAAINQLTSQYLYNIHGQSYRVTLSYPGTAAGSATAQQAISAAASELGKPYVYGAEGPNSFDCSGLTQYVTRASGVSIPRTSQDQYRLLPKVNPADIQPGDLIFPGAEFNGGNPTHVMMYIGNGQCIEAPHTGADVRVTALPASFAATRWS
ncbi:C40 family peptidase [Nocardia sp. NBC_01327]|uniref:C40 family peptidase n=1 Tax=Nocardia sp. NBC_01327 TaxID=2903593 RepID=UPI002E158FBF|nr:NlpC/P60 family protein [Nocardia sp. NBC_01327]